MNMRAVRKAVFNFFGQPFEHRTQFTMNKACAQGDEGRWEDAKLLCEKFLAELLSLEPKVRMHYVTLGANGR